MRITPNSNSLTAALSQINARRPANYSVPAHTTANQLSKISEGDLKAKLYENRHGLTDFQYNIKNFINANMNFTQRL